MTVSVESWLDLLRCPADGAELRNEGAALRCTGCGASYSHGGGVVQFVQGDGAALDNELKRQEMHARDAAAPEYDAMFAARQLAIELPPCLEALDAKAGDVVCELGAGTGRFTLLFAERVARVVALDFSLRSLLLLRDRLPEALRSRVLLVQADACHPPVVKRSFDKVCSFGMLHHLPDDSLRRRVVEAGSELLKPGGTATFSMYHWSRQKQAMAARGEGDYTHKHGFHSSGIFYYNFDERELRDIWQSAKLKVDRVRGLEIGFRGAGLLGPLQVPVNRLLAPTAWGRARSHMLLMRGVREE